MILLLVIMLQKNEFVPIFQMIQVKNEVSKERFNVNEVTDTTMATLKFIFNSKRPTFSQNLFQMNQLILKKSPR